MRWNKYTVLDKAETSEQELLKFLNEWYSTSEYITQLTSGSTGKPKEIRIKKSVMIASAKATNAFFQLTEKSRGLLCISPTYIGGKMMIVRAIAANMELVIAKISSNPLAQVKGKIDFCAMVPLQAESSVGTKQFNLIQKLIIGGAPVSETLEQKLKNKETRSFAAFGMTETVSHIAVRELNGKNEPYKAVGSTFFSEESGCLVIHAPHLDIFSLTTNDAVELISDTTFYWKGRVDFVINSGGVKIHPEVLEQKIRKNIKQQEIIAFGLPDKKLGSAVQLLVEGARTDFSANWKAGLHPYEIPKAVYFLNKFEYTASGKLDRKATLAKLNFER